MVTSFMRRASFALLSTRSEFAPTAAHRVNVEGTRNVNRFALTLPHLKRYHYVSTCYVAGRRTGLILETELRHEAGFRNFYEETKYLAELEVEALKGELPVTIHRPSVVCGDSRTGETAKYDGVYYLINYLRMRPDLLSLANIGNREVRLNVVPVDFVVEAMAALAADDRAVAGSTVRTCRHGRDRVARVAVVGGGRLGHRGARPRVPHARVRDAPGAPSGRRADRQSRSGSVV